MSSADTFAMVLTVEPSIRFQLTGCSMEPLLFRGQRVDWRPPGPLIAGNCYFFRYRRGILLHRLVRVKGTTALLMGDNSSSIEQVECRDILAELDDATGPLYRYGVAVINRLSLWCAHHVPPPLGGGIMRLRRRAVRAIFRCAALRRRSGAAEEGGSGCP
ncbi:MAG: S24/S26 family peptidase [Chitinispirillaceae bacterium]|nr:S24/S26 family peptidase [Chitinispirillaceae bacterium]